MIDMIARIVAQNPYLTYYIQSMNNNGPQIRNTFAEAVNELRDVINNGNEDKFVDLAIKATKNMGDISGALGRKMCIRDRYCRNGYCTRHYRQ